MQLESKIKYMTFTEKEAQIIRGKYTWKRMFFKLFSLLNFWFRWV